MTALYTLVQSGASATGTGSVAVTTSAPTTSGNCLIVGLVVGVTSTAVNAPNANWRLAQTRNIAGTGTGKVWIWYLEGKYNPGGQTSFTFTGPTGAAMTGSVDEYSLPSNYSLFYETTGVNSSGGGSVNAATLNASGGNSADCLGIGVWGATFSTAPSGQSWNTISGWTKSGNKANGTLNYAMYRNTDVAYSTGVSLAGGFSTTTNATGWSAALAMFRARIFVPDGLSGTERTTGLVIDPSGQLCLMTGDVEGMWRSADMGDHWQGTQNTLYNGGENQSSGACWSLLENNTIYVGLGAFGTHFGPAGFYASPDGGVTWVKRNGTLHYSAQNPGTPPSPANEGGGGDRAIGNHHFAQDTANNLLYTAAYDGFYRSAGPAYGTTWTNLSSSFPGTTSNLYCRAVANNPAQQKELWVCTWNVGPSSNGGTGTAIAGVYHTNDGTVGTPTWTQCSGYTDTVADVVVVGGWAYFACNKGGVYRCQAGTTVMHSLNGASNAVWGPATLTGLQVDGTTQYNGIDGYVDGNGNHVILVASGGQPSLPAANNYQSNILQITLPGGSTTGMTWLDCLNQPGGTVNVGHILPLYQGTYERTYWGASLGYHNYLGGGAEDGGVRVTVNQTKTNQIFATGQGGVFRSDDGGVTWNNAINGINMMDYHFLAWDPVHPNHWVACSDDHPEMDVNGGANGDWTGAGSGTVVEQKPGNTNIESHAVAFDPVDATTFVGVNGKYADNNSGAVFARQWNRPADAIEIGYTAAVAAGTGSTQANAAAVIGLYAGRDGSNNYFLLALAQGAGCYRATCPAGSDPTVKANWTWTAPTGVAANIVTGTTLGQTNHFTSHGGSAATIFLFDKGGGVYRTTNYGINTSGQTWTLIYPARVTTSNGPQAGNIALNPNVGGEVWITTALTNGLRRLSGANTGIIGQAGGGTDTAIPGPSSALANPGSVNFFNGQPYVVSTAIGTTPPGFWTCAGDPTVGANWTSIGGPEFQQYLANPGRMTAISATGQIIIATPSNNSVVGTLGGGSTPPPTLAVATTTLPVGQIGVAYSFTLTATGGTRPYTWSQTGGTLPAGLSLNTSTGVISGTPTGSPSTATGLVFTVTDSSTPFAATASSPSLSLQVTGTQLAITTTSCPAGTAGVSYSTTLAAVNGTSPYTWTVVTGTLPLGLNLASGGTISGTPTTAGTYVFTVQVADSATPTHATATQQLTIIIGGSALAVQTVSPLPGGQIGVAYAAGLTATGGVPPYTWAKTAGTLPAGLLLDANGAVTGTAGEIYGTPTGSPGTASGLTFQVTDSVASTASTGSLSLTTTAALLDITTTSLPDGAIGTVYSQTLAAVNGTAPYTWSVISGAFPPGLTLNTSTGVISGTPTVPGLASFTVQCTDSTGGTPETDQQPLTINIPSSGITVTTATLPQAIAGDAYSATLTASGGVPPYTWAVLDTSNSNETGGTGSLPAGFTLNASTGAVTGSSSVLGSTPVTFQVTDSASNNATAVLALIVAPPPAPEGVAALLMLTPGGTWAEPVPSSLAASPTTIPLGMTCTGYAYTAWATGEGNPLQAIPKAQSVFGANTIRLQVGVPLLLGRTSATTSWDGGGPTSALTSYLASNGPNASLNGNSYNSGFLAYLDQAVALCRSLGLTCVLCAQHEGLDNTAVPTAADDLVFWKILHDHYGDTGIICDLYNEPSPGGVASNSWQFWQTGGRGSDGVTYLGMQTLLTDLRTYGLTSTFWVEGIGNADTLAGIAGSAGNFALTDTLNKTVYSIHHPTGAHTTANWADQFGYLAGTGIPFTVGEWTNYAGTGTECWTDAATAVPAFLDYVQQLGCGLTAYSMNAGQMVVDQVNWEPTGIGSNYRCDGTVTGQGAGALIQAMFAAEDPPTWQSASEWVLSNGTWI